MFEYCNNQKIEKKFEELLKKLDFIGTTVERVNFNRPVLNDKDGLYAFSDRWGYNLLILEKGKINTKNNTEYLFDLLFWIFDYIISEEAATLEAMNRNDFDTWKESLINNYSYQLMLSEYLGVNFKKRFEIKIDLLKRENLNK